MRELWRMLRGNESDLMLWITRELCLNQGFKEGSFSLRKWQ